MKARSCTTRRLPRFFYHRLKYHFLAISPLFSSSRCRPHAIYLSATTGCQRAAHFDGLAGQMPEKADIHARSTDDRRRPTLFPPPPLWSIDDARRPQIRLLPTEGRRAIFYRQYRLYHATPPMPLTTTLSCRTPPAAFLTPTSEARPSYFLVSDAAHCSGRHWRARAYHDDRGDIAERDDRREARFTPGAGWRSGRAGGWRLRRQNEEALSRGRER